MSTNSCNPCSQMSSQYMFIGEEHKSQSPQTFENSSGTIIVWPKGDAILLSNEVVGRGLSKIVYVARDLRSEKKFCAAFVNKNEITLLNLLKGKRGIAQIHGDMFGKFGEKYEDFFYGELYDSDLEKSIQRCSLEDIKVIVEDLTYAIIALEGEDPKGEWIEHGDIKDANVFLKIDKISKRVLGAYLGDFGSAEKQKTVETNAETLEQEMELYGCSKHARRETQRERFISSVFHQIKDYMKFHLKSNISLSSLCTKDSNSHKLMQDMEIEYDYILSRKYYHFKD